MLLDPGSFLKVVHTLLAVKHQIQAADYIVINKQSLYSEKELKETETIIYKLNPHAIKVKTDFAQFSYEPWSNDLLSLKRLNLL